MSSNIKQFLQFQVESFAANVAQPNQVASDTKKYHLEMTHLEQQTLLTMYLYNTNVEY